jgi:aminodeoxychorismate lyase
VEEQEAVVSVMDRGFLYGDSVFETLRVANGRPFRWPLHAERLRKGAEFLGIPFALSPKEVRATMVELLEANQRSEGLLRITLSRGVGPRGYSPKDAGPPTLAMTVHDLPAPAEEWRVRTSSFRLAVNDKLTTHKVGSRLLNVLARREAEAEGFDEALIVNTNGEVVEAAGSNVFWLKRNVVVTTPSALAALPGVTRAVVLEICATLGIPNQKHIVSVAMLHQADAVFLTNSAQGIVSVSSIDGESLPSVPLVATLRAGYADLLVRETVGTAGAHPGKSDLTDRTRPKA